MVLHRYLNQFDEIPDVTCGRVVVALISVVETVSAVVDNGTVKAVSKPELLKAW